MGRLVRVPTLRTTPQEEYGEGSRRTGGPEVYREPVADDYLMRMAKYVPAEVLAFSLVVNNILDQALRTGGKTAVMAGFPVMTVASAALILGMILTPIYAWYVKEEGDAWVTNAFVSFLAYPVWAYALNAVAFADYRDGNLSTILLFTFTVISGLVKPRMPKPVKRVVVANPTARPAAAPAPAPTPLKAAAPAPAPVPAPAPAANTPAPKESIFAAPSPSKA